MRNVRFMGTSLMATDRTRPSAIERSTQMRERIATPNPLSTSGSSIPAEITVPPSGFIAGIYARNDAQNGVAKAPANEVLLGASRFERA